MSTAEVNTGSESASPRSVVVLESSRMNNTSKPSMNDGSMASGLSNGDAKASSSLNKDNPAPPGPASTPTEIKEAGKKTEKGPQFQPPPASAHVAIPNHIDVHKLPSNYYLGYHQSSDAPPSPAISHSIAAMPYDVFMQQPGAFTAVQAPSFGVQNSNTPLSPPRVGATPGYAGVPPASPLFPRVSSTGLEAANGVAAITVAPQSPSLPYMSPGMGSYVTRMTSSDESWDRNLTHAAYPSPQIGGQGLVYGIMPRTGGRAYSFDGEAMLPAAVLDLQDQNNPGYSSYNTTHTNTSGATVFTHQQQWSYPGPPPDMYAPPASPLQPRATTHVPISMYNAGQGMGTTMVSGAYGQPNDYYPSTSPGPPIQTTASNKGPDGANLFIFHIPNHFTNVDMYNLFCRFGNLLSVRIMVEKDTGRSRGFGFVSYDNPESAAAAIKELNGYTIGNKRLKVQHKQIRSRDFQGRDGLTYGQISEGFGRGDPFTSSLPPAGPQSLWYESQGEEAQVKSPADGVSGTITASSPESVVGHGSSNKTDDGMGDLTSTTTTTANESSSVPSPLVDMSSLQASLPEVPENVSHE